MKNTQGPTMLISARVKPEIYKLLEELADHYGENIRQAVERAILLAVKTEGLRI